MNRRKNACLRLAVSIMCVFATTACADSTSSVSLRGYNHMKNLSIHIFTVNGAAGPNVRPESGGGETCCVRLPKTWTPGLRAKVAWEYDQMENASDPLPENRTAEVDIPEYRSVGSLHVHFYENHKVKIVVSSCSPQHPFYPMNAADIAPWQPSGTKEEWREAARRGGLSNDC